MTDKTIVEAVNLKADLFEHESEDEDIGYRMIKLVTVKDAKRWKKLSSISNKSQRQLHLTLLLLR